MAKDAIHGVALKRLDAASQALPRCDAPALPGQIADWVAAIPFQEISAADDAVECWISTRHWPQLGNSVIAQLQIRIQSARSIVRAELTLPPVIDDALDLLLIRFWHSKGIEQARMLYPPGGSPPPKNVIVN